MSPPHFSLHSALTAWQWGPFPICTLVVLVAVSVWYMRAQWHLATRGRMWPLLRTVPFFAGLAVVELAVQSPVATFTGRYFQAHVIQHLLLMVVAPPLLALGAPSTLLLQSGGRTLKRRWLAVLHSPVFAVLSHPVVVWFLYFGGMFAFFLTPLINTAMHDMAVMDCFNLAFLLSGTLYWWPVVGIDPIARWRMGYGARIATLAIGVPFEAFLGIAIMGEHRPVATMYTLGSTHAGGALLWAATEISTFLGMAPVFLQWLRADERAAARADAAGARAAGRTGTPGPAPAMAGAPIGAAASGAGPAGVSHAGPAPELSAKAPTAAGDDGVRNRQLSPMAEQFRPLLQPGNSSWEAMWRAKAGFVPKPATAAGNPEAAPAGD
jgi:putative copper resistance protein D